MIDSGRRFFPVPLVENLLDTMAATKLNILHLHASDMCRFGVESKKFPSLTKSLTGIHAGFYTQDDVKLLQQYAKERGIRVVPEFDVYVVTFENHHTYSNDISLCTVFVSTNDLVICMSSNFLTFDFQTWSQSRLYPSKLWFKWN